VRNPGLHPPAAATGGWPALKKAAGFPLDFDRRRANHSMTISYSDRFRQKDAVESYDSKEYGSGSYSAAIWQLQRPVLERILKDFRQRTERVRLLDFACGTGRVLASLESLVDSAEGIDISENMVAVARTKCVQARLLVGDILASPELLQKKYEVISCFRFLLNVEPEIRGRVLHRLREVLRVPDGRLLVTVHGNARSLRHPAIAWRRRRERTEKSGTMLNEMSPAETKTLLRESGFQVVRQFGFGILPPTLYRTPLRRLAVAVDQSLAGDHWWNDWSIDMLFVCRPC
jgi:SAM-dependent methyltransferase